MWAAAGEPGIGSVLVWWAAAVLCVMMACVLEVGADCTCKPDACSGSDDLNFIFTQAGAGDITKIECSDLPPQTLPATIGNLLQLKNM